MIEHFLLPLICNQKNLYYLCSWMFSFSCHFRFDYSSVDCRLYTGFCPLNQFSLSQLRPIMYFRRYIVIFKVIAYKFT